MNATEERNADLELASKDLRSEYVKPNLEPLKTWSNIIGISIPIEP
jgi:hypothetical protein